MDCHAKIGSKEYPMDVLGAFFVSVALNSASYLGLGELAEIVYEFYAGFICGFRWGRIVSVFDDSHALGVQQIQALREHFGA